MNSLFLRLIWLVLLQCAIFSGCKSRQVSLVEARHAEQSLTARQLYISDTLLFFPLPIQCSSTTDSSKGTGVHASNDTGGTGVDASFGSGGTGVHASTEPGVALLSRHLEINHSRPFLLLRHTTLLDTIISNERKVDTNFIAHYKPSPINAAACRQEKGFLSSLKDACAIVFLLGFLAVIVKLLLINQKS